MESKATAFANETKARGKKLMKERQALVDEQTLLLQSQAELSDKSNALTQTRTELERQKEDQTKRDVNLEIQEKQLAKKMAALSDPAKLLPLDTPRKYKPIILIPTASPLEKLWYSDEAEAEENPSTEQDKYESRQHSFYIAKNKRPMICSKKQQNLINHIPKTKHVRKRVWRDWMFFKGSFDAIGPMNSLNSHRVTISKRYASSRRNREFVLDNARKKEKSLIVVSAKHEKRDTHRRKHKQTRQMMSLERRTRKDLV